MQIDIELNCSETSNDFNFSGLAQVKPMASKHSIWMMYSTADMFVMSGCLESRVSRWLNCLLNEHQMTISHHQMANVIRTSFTLNLSLLRFFRNNWTVITVKCHAEYPNIIRLTIFSKTRTPCCLLIRGFI